MKTGIGVIGCGLWGRNFLRNFHASEQFFVAAIADSDPLQRDEIARLWPDTPVFADVEDVVRHPGVEAVAIATPAAAHFEGVRLALAADLHVLVAKPMTTSSRDAEMLCELADRRGRVLMVDHTYVLSEGMRTIRTLLARGELRDVTRFDSVRQNTSAARDDVNLIWDLAPHDLSILDAVFGLDCEHMRIELEESPHELRVQLRYPGGRVAHLDFGWAGAEKVRVVTLTASERTLIWNDLDPDALVTLQDRGKAPRVIGAPPARETLFEVVEHFGDVIAGRTQSLLDGHHGVHIVRMLEKLQRLHDDHLRSRDAKQRLGDRSDVLVES